MVIVTLLSLIIVVIAARKWHVVQHRRLILSHIAHALKNSKCLWAGIPLGVLYLMVFMILGGKGGRIHVLFGRLIWNTTLAEILLGLVLAALVMISMALFVYWVHLKGLRRLGTEGGIGLAGSLLALLACFCP
jgi:hypothetical protein